MPSFLRPLLAVALLAAAACGGDGTSPARDALGGYVAVGASLTAGFMSDGLVYDGQEAAYPSQLARAAGFTLTVARVAAPGCIPPFVAPLSLDRTLAGRRAFTAARDTGCVGRFADSVFARNVAVPEMTAYQAFRYTADSALRPSDPRTRRALPQILLPGYTQATQAVLANPGLVSVELGFTEIVRAVRSGRMVAATEETYRADTAFTYVPFDVWRPWYDSVLTELAAVRRGVLLTVPAPEPLPALRRGAALHAQRDSLRRFGVAVADDCAASDNRVFLAKVAAAAASSVRLAAPRALSCADVPGAADSVLTPADLATLTAVRDAMNAYIGQAAEARGWATADVAPLGLAATTYSPGEHLAGVGGAFGLGVSLDGIYPAALGHRSVAGIVAVALRERYGLSFEIAVPGVDGTPRPAW